MKAIEVTRHGGPEVLQWVERDRPVPGPGQALIRVRAAGVNYIDTYFREGTYPRDTPFVPGDEGCGEVVEVGEGSGGPEAPAPGDLVAWCQGPGSYAEYVVVETDRLVVVPDGVDPATAASMLLQGLTAHYLVTDTHRGHPGDPVLVHAAAGGVGQLLVQMAAARGYRVLGTASTGAKRERVRALGAEAAWDYADATGEAVREWSGGGVATVFDGVGRDTFDASLASLRPRGSFVLYGAASGPVPPVDPQRLNSGGSLFLTRPTLAHYIASPEEFRWRAGEVVDAVARGELRVEVGARFPMAEAAQAHSALQSRGTTGSVVLLAD